MDILMRGAGAAAAGASTAAAPKGRAPTERPWVEKYRPKNTDEVAHQAEVIAVLKACIKGADMPHLLFYGPPGTGKTSTILAVARELFGPELMKERVLELNASDERGIDVIRDKVKAFASLSAATKVKGYPCPPYKLVILDEADAMTHSAQSALRRTIENHAKVTRFCIICNYVTRIIEPLSSRCAKFRFQPLSHDTMLQRLEHIVLMEKANCDREVLSQLIELSEGDMRASITLLQSLVCLVRGGRVTEKHVSWVTERVPKEDILALWQACSSGSFEKVEERVSEVMCGGFPATQLLVQLHDHVVQSDSITDTQKAKIVHVMAQMDKNLIEGADEQLQVMNLCAQILSVLSS